MTMRLIDADALYLELSREVSRGAKMDLRE